jgi:hypothetical protein
MAIKKSSGPKTAQGKSIASKNSTTHGLTSKQASSADERTLVHSYTEELLDYYAPHSPLERMQIERIAICKAKLSRLYELEQTKLDKLSSDLENSPDLILEQMPAVHGVVKGMLTEWLLFKKLTLPCKLDTTLLQAICNEITSFLGDIDSEEVLRKNFPIFAQYLLGFSLEEARQQGSLHGRLKIISEKISQSLGDGENYHEMIISFVDPVKSAEEKVPEEKDELDLYVEEQQAKREAQRAKANKKSNLPTFRIHLPGEIAFPKSPEIKKYLAIFKQLQKVVYQVMAAKEAYEGAKDFAIRSVALPQAESDLLMRYQTTLERRLSNAIGELMVLQRHRVLPAK